MHTNATIPNNYKKLQSFLGLVSFCRKFIKNLAHRSIQLYKMLTKDFNSKNKFILTPEAIAAFDKIKKSLLTLHSC